MSANVGTTQQSTSTFQQRSDRVPQEQIFSTDFHHSHLFLLSLIFLSHPFHLSVLCTTSVEEQQEMSVMLHIKPFHRLQ